LNRIKIAMLAAALSGCARPASEPCATASTEPKPSAARTEAVRTRAQPWRTFRVDPDPKACHTPGMLMIQHLNNHTCLPLERPEELVSSLIWSKPVLLRAPTLTRWNRKLRCKSMQCRDMGVGIDVGNGSGQFLAVRKRGTNSPWTMSDVTCPRPEGPGCTDTLPHIEPNRVWLGIVSPHFVEGSDTPTLTFDLLAVEEARPEEP
jgi:hypothetical protein